MIFKHLATARRPALRAALATMVAAVGLASLLSACGGGTSQYEVFEPARLFAFGDENSLLTPTGRKYGVNAINPDTDQVDCRLEPLWVQQVADSYGFSFAECNPNSVFEPQAHMFAALGATVADVAAQVEAQVAAGGFRGTDLALVLAGGNDVLQLYAQYPARPEASLISDAQARGRQLAAVVNRLVALDAKVVVSNLPDMGVSPYALAEKAAHTDTDRAAVLSRLTAAFNDALGTNVLLDGRYVGLMQTDLRTQAAQRLPASVGLANASEGVCTVVLPTCTSKTLITGATASLYLWSDSTRLAPGGQGLLAGLAIERARRNPF
jgi:outer membrane lipase/esterase